MRFPSILLLALFIALTATAAHAQHGGRQMPAVDPNQRGPNPWVARLINAINEGTGVEAWKEKEAMRMRIEIEFDPPKPPAEDDDEGADAAEEVEDASAETAKSIHGLVTYDLQKRIMRFDYDGGIVFLANEDEIAIWPRDAERDPLTRDDVPDDALDMVRSLYHLVILPLWINDPDGFFTPGGLRTMMDEPYYAAARLFREPPEAEKAEDEGEPQERPAARRYPDDWYIFFSDTYKPHRLDAAAILMHDRSRPLAEFPMPRVYFFDDFKEVEGVQIARTWRIHQFSRVQGPGERIGGAKVSSVEFVPREGEAFEAPERAVRVR